MEKLPFNGGGEQLDKMFEDLKNGIMPEFHPELQRLAQEVIERMNTTPPEHDWVKNFAAWSASFDD